MSLVSSKKKSWGREKNFSLYAYSMSGTVIGHLTDDIALSSQYLINLACNPHVRDDEIEAQNLLKVTGLASG